MIKDWLIDSKEAKLSIPVEDIDLSATLPTPFCMISTKKCHYLVGFYEYALSQVKNMGACELGDEHVTD